MCGPTCQFVCMRLRLCQHLCIQLETLPITQGDFLIYFCNFCYSVRKTNYFFLFFYLLKAANEIKVLLPSCFKTRRKNFQSDNFFFLFYCCFFPLQLSIQLRCTPNVRLFSEQAHALIQFTRFT